ncbi:MAG: hypothetical protein NZ554_13300, partial [Bryobacteraceae bacterium]|nr:hypothetical protein [Bryobacteraceae bacterium]
QMNLEAAGGATPERAEELARKLRARGAGGAVAGTTTGDEPTAGEGGQHVESDPGARNGA